MARLNIDTGTLGNPATGDTLRTAMTKINTNFLELYTDLAATTSSGGVLTNPVTNGHVKIVANGTGIVEIDRLSINNTTISSLDTNADITLTANGTGSIVLAGPVTASEITTNEISTNGSNADLKLITSGTGDILLKGKRVGIADVNQPDSLLHLKDTNAVITLQRTADANTPGLSFQQSGGNVRAVIKMDGTSGTSNEIFFQTYSGSLAERFRVTHTGAKVSGTLNVDDGISITDNTITSSASNADLELSASGSGEVTTDANIRMRSGTPLLKIQRTDNANVPGIDFQGSAGTSGAKILFDGTGGTANELIFQTFTVSGGLAEAFRVQGGGAKVTGTLDIDGGVSITDNTITSSASNADLELKASGTGDVIVGAVRVHGTTISSDDSTKITFAEAVDVNGNLAVTGAQVDFTNLPTSDPTVAGRLWNDSGTVKISAG